MIMAEAILPSSRKPSKTMPVLLWQKNEKLIVSETNKNDIIDLLGKPSTKSTFDNDVWIYIERKQTQSQLKNLGRMGNIGAGDEFRTHDILVGNEMLYH